MKSYLQKLIKFIAYLGAAIVIILAIAVGIFRMMLPRLPEYQEEIKGWASAAIGMEVEFSGMNARWRLSGPELSFFDAELQQPETGKNLLRAQEVSVGVGLLRLIADRELVVDRVSIRDTLIDIRQDEEGEWLLQGTPLDELLGSRDLAAQQGGNVEVVGENIAVAYEHPATGQVLPLTIESLSVLRKQAELILEGNIDLPEEFGGRLEVSATQLDRHYDDTTWQFYVKGDALAIAGWSRLQPVGLPFVDSGTLDLNLWVDVSAGRILRATSDLRVRNFHAIGPEILAPVDVQGVFEYSTEADGWLLGANQLRLSTADGDWPESELQVRMMQGPDGALAGLRTSASYFNLDDLKYIIGWLPREQQVTLIDYNPSGILRDATVELTGMQSDDLQFDISADLESAGIASVDNKIGVRELSGRVRADRDGGRVEIESTDLRLDLRAHLAEVLLLEDAFGTVIWRRNAAGMLVLSDSVRIRNTDFESQLSLQVSVPDDGSAPVVDFDSSWSVYDLSTMHRYLPVQLISPTLRQWLADALVSGRVNRGTTRFNGALDRFPFDSGDGVFRIEARLQDAILKYSDNWPAPEFRHLDLVVDGTRLYSQVNSAVNLGNEVENAQIEIADLRDPILEIEAFATGSMKTIQNYVANSPIDKVLGGQGERVTVDGGASFNLEVTYPIQDKEAYDFATRVRLSDAMLRVDGLAAPITELNGVISVTRDDATSDSLIGRFLGQSVDLDLQRIGDEQSPYSVMLNAVGRTTASALEAEFGAPIGSVLSGDADYVATVRFPNDRGPQPGPLQVQIESDLFGIQSDLPAPLGKSDEEPLPMTLNIEFPAKERITAAGTFADELSWHANFLKADDAWDFDRGVLAIGGEAPRDPEVRGLHIHGPTADLDLHAWLAAGRSGDRQMGLGERIRSIEVDVDRFYAIGQKFTDHRIIVNRGGAGWRVQMIGEEANGLVTVPYDFDSGRPMILEMERLILPGDDEVDSGESSFIDPRVLPGIAIQVQDFGIGNRRLGQLEADFEKTNRGLEASNLVTTDATYTISGGAGWIVDAYEESGQRTFFDAELKSTNAQETFNRLDYEPGVIGDSMAIDLSVGWAGGPRKDFMGLINGDVSVNLGAGRLVDVEPGAGRVFGLMSFTALPRRLALDFRDVFDTGFSFDQITGNFRLVNGEAFTCDLTVAGTSADVGIVGRTGLVARDYNQSAIVSANVGNTLPVVGGLIGGPQVAAALFVFSQLFRKPLKDVGQAYYSVAGSWDEPVIDRADSQRFVETSSLASCIDVSQ
ncbi:MAG: YhdP family protein [Woeseiaceae bacterium]